MKYKQFYESINWSTLENGAIMKFASRSFPGFEVAKCGDVYEATLRSRFAPDDPYFTADSVDDMARFLYGYGLEYVVECKP